MSLSVSLRTTASVVCLLTAAATGQAAAQTVATPPGPPSGPAAAKPAAQPSYSAAPSSIDEIVVTAQRRTQNLQDVPIVVTTVSRQLLQDSGVKDIKDLALLTPGLLVTSTTSEASTTARIRGIGTVGDNPGLESSVGVMIDGVYRSRNGVGFGDLGDVDRIEVLKGPQGTLFGKSTSAGEINIVTAPPKFTFGSNAEFTVGNYGALGGSAQVTGPLIADKLAGSLFFSDRSRDGYFKVNDGPGPNTASSDTDRNYFTLRGQLLALPTENLSLRLIADYSHRDEQCCIAVITRGGVSQQLVGALGGSDGNPADPYARNAYSNRPDGQKITDGGVSLQADYRFPNLNATLTSITAYRDWKTKAGFDADFSTADIDYLPSDDSNSNEFRTISQEVRFAGSTDKLDYLVGGFYSNETLRSNSSVRVGSQFEPYLGLLFSSLVTGAPNPNFLKTGLAFPYVGGVNYNAGDGSVDQYRQKDDSYAIFTNETLHVTSKFDLNVGIRYTDDEKVLNTKSANIGGGAGCAAANTSFALLPAAVAEELAAVNSTLCLPFLSPGYNNFTDRQAEGEQEVTGTVKATYRFDPRILVYGSYARGYKAGGFNLDRVECTIGQPGCAPGSAAAITPDRNTSFPGEFVNSFELGEKATLFDRKLLFNATLFYQEYTGFQLNTFTGLVFVVDSVPKVISQGIDTDFVWFPMHNLSFQGGLTVADTRFDLNAAQLATFQAKTGYLGSGGSRISLAPLYSLSASGTYKVDLPRDYLLRFNLGMKFSSDYNTGSDLDPGKVQAAYTLWNGRVVFAPQGERWAVELWAENLFNTQYKQVAFDSGFQNVPTNSTGVIDAFLGAPRTFGLTFRAKY
jgi:outer membrane receptor protein involved in Fe transport